MYYFPPFSVNHDLLNPVRTPGRKIICHKSVETVRLREKTVKILPEGKGKLRTREEKQENRAGLGKLEDVK